MEFGKRQSEFENKSKGSDPAAFILSFGTHRQHNNKPRRRYGLCGSYAKQRASCQSLFKNASSSIIDHIHRWYAGDNNSKNTMERVSPYVRGETQYNWSSYASGTSTPPFAKDADGNDIFGTPKAKTALLSTLRFLNAFRKALSGIKN